MTASPSNRKNIVKLLALSGILATLLLSPGASIAATAQCLKWYFNSGLPFRESPQAAMEDYKAWCNYLGDVTTPEYPCAAGACYVTRPPTYSNWTLVPERHHGVRL